VKSRGDLSQVDAARLVGCSRDTIVRARRSGRFPGARLDGDRWLIPAADLVAAGIYQPETPGDTPSASTPGAPPPADSTAVELARAEARIAGLNEVVARQDDELRFLRLTVETLTKRGAA
jgi:excisionase family DNA binding protein